MSEANNWNDKTITEFRANGGRVGGNFEGAPVALVHHRGRKSGREYVNPVMYLEHTAWLHDCRQALLGNNAGQTAAGPGSRLRIRDLVNTIGRKTYVQRS